MCQRVAVIHNAASPSRYDLLGERRAVVGVLEAVEAVSIALSELDYEVVQVPLTPPLEESAERLKSLGVDLVFNLFEGYSGCPETEAEIADVLMALGVAHTGCPAPVLRLGLDKARVKEILLDNGIDTPAFQVLDSRTVSTFRLRYPCIVKPYGEDASHGISRESVVDSLSALKEQVARVTGSYGGRALVEEFIDGREFNVTILGNFNVSVLPVSEIDYDLPSGAARILTYAAKWEPTTPEYGGTKAVCPARITNGDKARIEEVALHVFLLLGCRGYARIDLRADRKGRMNVLEVNPNPDISPGSGAVRQAEAAGMTYAQFIRKITEIALERS
ncbi:MAG: ATP-grasp domain-containing protein [Dehalococcoidia bacterium]|nr:ATP-grasp domain-containing protein [Dehalococcoidia bacterium]MBL7164979.1 ATP-grasp domain-containing protein [Dehalococcoidales bacterium]